jgi:hypothetical protein
MSGLPGPQSSYLCFPIARMTGEHCHSQLFLLRDGGLMNFFPGSQEPPPSHLYLQEAQIIDLNHLAQIINPFLPQVLPSSSQVKCTIYLAPISWIWMNCDFNQQHLGVAYIQQLIRVEKQRGNSIGNSLKGWWTEQKSVKETGNEISDKILRILSSDKNMFLRSVLPEDLCWTTKQYLGLLGGC